MTNPQPFTGQAAIVTGASRRIGKAVAQRLAAGGARVALLARNAEVVKAAAAELAGLYPDQVTCAACDVASREGAAVVEKVIEELGRIDILVNNAGVTRDNLFLRMSEEDWDQVMATNLKGLFHVTKVVAKHMLRSRAGRIINITSVVGMVGNAGQTNYAASKGGVIAFTFSLARELASRGITVNAVAPGLITTDMTAAMTDEARNSF